MKTGTYQDCVPCQHCQPRLEIPVCSINVSQGPCHIAQCHQYIVSCMGSLLVLHQIFCCTRFQMRGILVGLACTSSGQKVWWTLWGSGQIHEEVHCDELPIQYTATLNHDLSYYVGMFWWHGTNQIFTGHHRFCTPPIFLWIFDSIYQPVSFTYIACTIMTRLI